MLSALGGPTLNRLEIFMAQPESAAKHWTMSCCSPAGLGKTTLSHIVAAELGVNLRQTSGPVLEAPAIWPRC